VTLRTFLVVLLALVFGASAAVGVNSLRNTPAPEPKAQTDTVPVVVVTGDVARFTTLSSSMLAIRPYPKDVAPASAATRVEDVADRVTLSPLVKDEPVLDSKLAARGTGHGMAPGIPKGMRAFTIQTPHVSSGVAGFILPGNMVDVLLTITNNGGGNDPTGGGLTVTLLQNIEILAVDQQLEAPANNKVDPNLRSVTLLVTPEQAAKLDLGQNKGTLHLALRNTEDSHAIPPRRVTLAEIESAGEVPKEKEEVKAPEKLAPAVAEVAPPLPVRIRTLRNNQMGVVELD
jgi:pilus assembly protein CpaB